MQSGSAEVCSFAAVWQGEDDKSYRKKEICPPSFGFLIKLTAVAEMARCQGFSYDWESTLQRGNLGTGGSHRCLCSRTASVLTNKPHSALLISLMKKRPPPLSVRIWCFQWVAVLAQGLWQVSLKPSNSICGKCQWKPHGTSFALSVEYLREDLAEVKTCPGAWNATLCNVS